MPNPVCNKCHLEIPSGSAVLYKKKPYHDACLERMKEKARAADYAAAKKTPPALSALQKYICQLFGIPTLTPYLHKQVASFFQDYHIPYEDILLTLQYFFEVSGGEIKDADSPTIGIVPYMLEEAKRFDNTLRMANAANAGFTPSGQQTVLTIRKPPSTIGMGYSIEDL